MPGLGPPTKTTFCDDGVLVLSEDVLQRLRRRDEPRSGPLELVLPAMVGVHVFIGIGEALITAAALGFIQATRPDLLNLRPDRAGALAVAT